MKLILCSSYKGHSPYPSQTVDQILFISVHIKAPRKSSKLPTKLSSQMEYMKAKISCFLNYARAQKLSHYLLVYW